MADYYGGNPLAEIRDLRLRIETLERLVMAREGKFAPAAGAGVPEMVLPAAADVPTLYLIETNSGDLYRLVCTRDNGVARLFLERAGRVRAY